MFFAFLRDYVRWHYNDALIGYIRILKNFWWFLVSFFSISILLKSLFHPYKRMSESNSDTLQNWIESKILNTLSRLIGFFVRLFIIVIGIVFISALIIGGVVFYVLWLVAPLLPLIFISLGLILIGSNL